MKQINPELYKLKSLYFSVNGKDYKIIGIESEPHVIEFKEVKDNVLIKGIFKMNYNELIKKIGL